MLLVLSISVGAAFVALLAFVAYKYHNRSAGAASSEATLPAAPTQRFDFLTPAQAPEECCQMRSIGQHSPQEHRMTQPSSNFSLPSDPQLSCEAWEQHAAEGGLLI